MKIKQHETNTTLLTLHYAFAYVFIGVSLTILIFVILYFVDKKKFYKIFPFFRPEPSPPFLTTTQETGDKNTTSPPPPPPQQQPDSDNDTTKSTTTKNYGLYVLMVGVGIIMLISLIGYFHGRRIRIDMKFQNLKNNING